jgi:hypothetical protein
MPTAGSTMIVGVLAIVCSGLRGVAYADPVFGLISTGAIGSGNGTILFPNQNWNFGLVNGIGNYQMVTSYSSPIESATGSLSGVNNVTESATAWASANNGVLHGYAAASVSGICATCPFAPAVGAGFFIQWIDTIFFADLPDGTPIDVMVTNALHSSTILGGGQAELQSDLVLGSGEADLTNNQGAADGLITQSFIVHTFAGSSLRLASTLAGNAGGDDVNGGESAIVDASDTANAYITVLTPGASYTTASGASYATPSAVPEPKSIWVLMVAAFAMAWLGTRRRSANRTL